MPLLIIPADLSCALPLQEWSQVLDRYKTKTPAGSLPSRSFASSAAQ